MEIKTQYIAAYLGFTFFIFFSVLIHCIYLIIDIVHPQNKIFNDFEYLKMIRNYASVSIGCIKAPI